MTITWYFDYISPFAYLQSKEIRSLTDRDGAPVAVTPMPVLFAGLLNHFGQLGPAEIPSKRAFTYRHTLWLGHQRGLPMRYPPAHPFRSLELLRATVAAGSSWAFIDAAFGLVWERGELPNEDNIAALLAPHNLAADALADPAVKTTLREATDDAANRGVFGVPTAMIGDELFWGTDAFAMLSDYCRDPALFTTPPLDALTSLPAAAVRPQSNRKS